jgi:hypothetical protein
MERSTRLYHLPESPGKWLVVPSRVGKQLNSQGAPKKTRNWLNNGKLAEFSGDSEHVLFMNIRRREKSLEDPDVQGIVIAYHRRGTYVVENGSAARVARGLGLITINAKEFLREVTPPLPGFG